MKFPEFFEENGKTIDRTKLEYHGRGEQIYASGRQVLVRACHDIFIEYNGGILLVIRDSFPAKDTLWPIGGGIEKGVLAEESLRKKVREECGLELEGVQPIGVSRTMWETDPQNTGKGSDDLNLIFYAHGKGELKLDKFHKEPRIVRKWEVDSLNASVHPYVKEWLGKAFEAMSAE